MVGFNCKDYVRKDGIMRVDVLLDFQHSREKAAYDGVVCTPTGIIEECHFERVAIAEPGMFALIEEKPVKGRGIGNVPRLVRITDDELALRMMDYLSSVTEEVQVLFTGPNALSGQECA